MYLPSHFEERRAAVLLRLIDEHPLGLLVTTSRPDPARSGPAGSPGTAGAGGEPAAAADLVANPLPWRWRPAAGAAGGPRASGEPRGPGTSGDPDAPLEPTAGTLVAHVARANPVWRLTHLDRDVLVVFQGPQAYVSPSAYPGKQAHGKVVPTWNYIVVQARGRLRVHDDRAWKHALVDELTTRHEADRAQPWAVGDAPADYLETMLQAIVGLEVEVTAWTGKWKLSQNRAAADRAGVAADLASRGGVAAQAARWMGGTPTV